MTALEQFHFLRPLWLLALPLLSWIWWLVRRRSMSGGRLNTLIAPHLLDALTVNRNARHWFRPIDGLAMALIAASLAAAGPTWSKQASPWFSETATLVIALEVSDSMRSNDLQPTRLERARFKILDLIARRTGARTALIAYAGSAHLVMPPTQDAEVIKLFLESLDPAVMPNPGASAAAVLPLALKMLSQEANAGTLLFVCDGFDAAEIPELTAFASRVGAPALAALILGTEEGGVALLPDGSPVIGPDGSRLDTRLDTSVLRRVSSEAGVAIVRARSIGDSDLAQLMRRIESNLQQADDPQARWKDQSWLLLWPAAFLVLLWFRRGWTMQWVWVGLLGGAILFTPGESRADGWIDWFLTPDQQGRMTYEDLQFSAAADLFEDPMWQGIAAYSAGRYEDAAAAFARVPTAEGFFNRGNALMKSGEYATAITAFEQAVAEAPDWSQARDNLALALYISEYIQRTREQSDTGDETAMGAGDFKFDNNKDSGQESVISGETGLEPQSAEKWMRSVDTRAGDFLRTRFAIEASREQQP
jgi:Ca-activated chloride channel family protein